MAQKPKQTKGVEAPSVPQVLPVQRQATPEEQARIQAQQQRARAEVAVLKQRFAETDVAKTIAEAERDQLFQQLQSAQRTIEQLTASLAEATKKSATKKDDEPKSEEE